MKNLILFVLSVLSIVSHSNGFEPVKLGTITTKKGVTYQDATVTAKLPDGIKLMHKDGLAKIPIAEIPEAIAQQLGGFDAQAAAAETERLAKEKAKRSLAASLTALTQAEIEATYAPLPSRITKLAEDVANKERLEATRQLLKTLQDTCEPMIADGSTTRETVCTWVRDVINETIRVGMPAKLVILAWGSPRKINTSSFSSDQWVYSSSYVYVKDGIVTAWQQ